MAIPVARVHLKVAHAALPALLPTPPVWKKLRLLPTPCVAAILPTKPPLAKPSRADSDERWDAHKTKSGSSTGSSAWSSPRSTISSAGRGSWRKNATSPLPPSKPGRADSAERWDAHKRAACPSSAVSRSSKCSISRASSAERWDAHKKLRLPAEVLDDGESSSICSNDIVDTAEEEEIVWKPWAIYAGPSFATAAPECSMLPMPTAFLVRVA